VDRATSPLSQGFNPAAAPAVPADLESYVNNPNDAPEVRTLKLDVAQTEMGLALLRFAQSKNVQFILDPGLQAKHSRMEYDPHTGNISIRPGLRQGGAVVDMAHEIRHVWQDKVLGAIKLENGVLTPKQRWTLRRYLEGDADAFSAYFEADRLNQGLPIGPGFAETMPASTIAMRLGGVLRNGRGLSFGLYRQLAFEPALGGLHLDNGKHLDYVEAMTLEFGKQVLAAGKDRQKLAALEDMVQRAPDDATFAAFLRHFGGVSLDPGKQTCLQSTSVTQDMLLNDYPNREDITPLRLRFEPQRDQKIAQLTDLQNSYIRVLHDASGRVPARQPKP
jgi:hypothetical protein